MVTFLKTQRTTSIFSTHHEGGEAYQQADFPVSSLDVEMGSTGEIIPRTPHRRTHI